MIIDNLDGLFRYSFENVNMLRAFEFLKTLNVEKLKIGRNDIDGDNVFANFIENEITKDNLLAEKHRRYADIQLVLEGEERICFGREIKIENDMLEKNDIALMQYQKSGFVDLKKGDFVVFFPGENHSPSNIPCGLKRSLVKKLIVKVLIAD